MHCCSFDAVAPPTTSSNSTTPIRILQDSIYTSTQYCTTEHGSGASTVRPCSTITSNRHLSRFQTCLCQVRVKRKDTRNHPIIDQSGSHYHTCDHDAYTSPYPSRNPRRQLELNLVMARCTMLLPCCLLHMASDSLHLEVIIHK